MNFSILTFQPPVLVPQITYSSSEDDEFFDATSVGYDREDFDSDEDTATDCECLSDCTETEDRQNFNGSFPTQAPALRSHRHHHGRHKNRRRHNHGAKTSEGDSEIVGESQMSRNKRSRGSSLNSVQSQVQPVATADQSGEPDWGDANEDFDTIYENTDESELGNVQQQHGSVLMHLLSQVSRVTVVVFVSL